MEGKWQSVILTLDDGRQVRFAGKAQLEAGADIRVTNIQITEPSTLPDGYYIEEFPAKPAAQEAK